MKRRTKKPFQASAAAKTFGAAAAAGFALILIAATAPAAEAAPSPEPSPQKWSQGSGSKAPVSGTSGGGSSKGSSGSRASAPPSRSGSSAGRSSGGSRGASGSKFNRPGVRRPTITRSAGRPSVRRGPSGSAGLPSSTEGRKWHPNNSGKDLSRPGPHRVGYGYHHGYGYHPFYYRYPYRGYYGFGYGSYYYPYGAYFSWGHPYGYGHHVGYRSGYGYADNGRYGSYGGGYSGDRGVGALDINIKPRKAEVYVDGQAVGNAGEYDGFPSHLWLEEGSYNLVFYEEGFETQARKVTVIPGLTIDVDGELAEGNATLPENLPPELMQPPAEELARIEREEARQATQEDTWRQRARDYRARQRPRTERAAGSTGALDLREAPGRLYLTIEPAEASVYLDGRFLGTGEEVSRLRSGLLVNAGNHDLQVVHPDFVTEERSIDVTSGEDLTLDLELSTANAA